MLPYQMEAWLELLMQLQVCVPKIADVKFGPRGYAQQHAYLQKYCPA